MTARSGELNGAHWRYAIAFYGRPGVEEACLTLQDEGGVDVVLMLMVSFAAQDGRDFVDHIAEADAIVSEWRAHVVTPLRAVRREMKRLPAIGFDGAADRLRMRVKALELDAEQIEAAMLADFVGHCSTPRAGVPSDLHTTLRAVVAFYAGPTLAASASLKEAVTTISTAAGEVA